MKKATGSDRPRLHWCPTGAFTFVPLHAAGIYEGPNRESCSDFVVSSYTPTLTALAHAQDKSPALATQQLKLALIASNSTKTDGLPLLWSLRSEVECIADLAKNAQVTVDMQNSSGAVTASRVIAALPSSHLVHIACHGIQNTAEPLKSSFCLSDRALAVTELMNLNLKNAFLAFLSACETAKGDQDQPDQSVHLAATMLFIGFRSVVASMW
jgi:CHAT domain-containing protein